MSTQPNAELKMTANKMDVDDWNVTIDVAYRGLDQAQLEQLEAVYFTFFAGLPDAMRVPLPARRVDDQDAP